MPVVFPQSWFLRGRAEFSPLRTFAVAELSRICLVLSPRFAERLCRQRQPDLLLLRKMAEPGSPFGGSPKISRRTPQRKRGDGDPGRYAKRPLEPKLKPAEDEERFPKGQAVVQQVRKEGGVRMRLNLGQQTGPEDRRTYGGKPQRKPETLPSEAKFRWPFLSVDQQVVGRKENVEIPFPKTTNPATPATLPLP